MRTVRKASRPRSGWTSPSPTGFGLDAIEDTYRRAFNEWKDDYLYLTDLVVVLNHKLWQHYEAGDEAKARLYNDLWQEAQAYGYDHLKGDELEYFWKVLD